MSFLNIFKKKEKQDKSLDLPTTAPISTYDFYQYDDDFNLPDIDIYRVFDKMIKYDDRIGANLKKRKQLLLSKGYIINAFDSTDKNQQKIVEWLNINLLDKKFNSLLDLLLNSIGYGFQVVQLKYKLENNYYYIDKINPVPQSLWDINAITGEIEYLGDMGKLNGNKLLTKYPKNFIWFMFERAPNGDPRGIGALHRAYWFYKFKCQDFVSWQKFLERFGVPLLIGKFEQKGDYTKMRKYAQEVINYLKKIRYDGVAAMGGSDISILEAKGNGEPFEKLVNICNEAIDVATLGTIMLTSPQGGSFNLAEVHSKILDLQTKSDGEALAYIINDTIIKWLVDANFGKQEFYPVFKFNFNKQATTEEIFKAIELGIPLDNNKLYTETGLPQPKSEETAFVISQETVSGTIDNSQKKKIFLDKFSEQEQQDRVKQAEKEVDTMEAYTQPAEEESVNLLNKDFDKWLLTKSEEYKVDTKTIKAMTDEVFSAFFSSYLIGIIDVNNDIILDNELEKNSYNLFGIKEIIKKIIGLFVKIDVSKGTSVKYLKTLIDMPEETYKRLYAKNYKYASTIAIANTALFEQEVKESLAQARINGLSKNEWVKKVIENNELDLPAPHLNQKWYWNNVYRTNNTTARTASIIDRVNETKERWFGYEYISILDKRTTPICDGLDGTIKAIDDAIWSTYMPPNHFMCRSTVARLSKIRAKIGKINYKNPIKLLPHSDKSFAENPSNTWTKLNSKQKEDVKKLGLENKIKQVNKEIDKNINKIIDKVK